jgi:acyl-CoA reductase-like NAD-dependent aldehyde dehydrogenase
MTDSGRFPSVIQNWIGGHEANSKTGATFEKLSPHDGRILCRVARSSYRDVDAAILSARGAQPGWAATPAVKRGKILFDVCRALEDRVGEIGAIVAEETGKAPREALGETGGAIALGRFFAGEGQRLYGRTTTSGSPNKYAETVREPCGVAGLIIAANTPIANVAWKVFPALICGNAVVLKAAEDTPATAWIFSAVAHDAGLPQGVLNVLQGFGQEVGARLVQDPRVDVISFTGSTLVGRSIAEEAGRRLAKVSLELGGKNAFIVCDDADLECAVRWACLSAFSNAGQRCASGSRMIVDTSVYDEFRNRFVTAAEALKVGPTDDDDLGPVINERQLSNMLGALEQARGEGATLLTGGHRLHDAVHQRGYYLAPTILEDSEPNSDLSTRELFGPIAALYRADGYEHALELANDSPYGLTACIHTRSFDRAVHFSRSVLAGVAVVNAGTYGSEPHMPFGGLRQSGNGSREPGTEALDVYSELKDIYFNIDPDRV